MADLHPEHAKAAARTALAFVASFNGEDFGHAREMQPGPHDGRHLAIALDQLEELAAMVLNLAGRCIAAPPVSAPVRLTDEDVSALYDEAGFDPQEMREAAEYFARAIESAVLRANGFKVEGGDPTQPALTPEQIEKADEAICEALSDAYDCGRVWFAWSYGTMGPEDFYKVSEDPERVAEIRNAAAAALGFKVD